MKNCEATFWLVAVASATLYGLMEAGRYWGGVQIAPVATYRLMLGTVLATYHWLPSFLAGLIVRRRAVLLALVTVLIGTFFAEIFRRYFAPTLFIDNWSPSIVSQTETLLAILEAAVSAAGGQFLATRRSRVNS